ncbi:MAG: class I SAM-dependent methyltransferase, partial [Pseudomonadota bacterium]
MRFKDAAAVLDGIPYTSPHKGRIFYDFILDNGIRSALELGFAHGVSSGYFAAALDQTDGRLHSVDLAEAGFSPAIEELVEKLGLEQRVEVHREISSYTWFLYRMIAAQTKNGICEPIYDFIFIDGPKDWTNDGAAFFMAAKLLKPGGWIMFDDYAWNYRDDERLRGKNHATGYVFPKM